MFDKNKPKLIVARHGLCLLLASLAALAFLSQSCRDFLLDIRGASG